MKVVNSRDFLAVLKRNVLTPVVVAIYTLGAILLYLHEYKDAFFISSVITFNVIFAIVQEIRAKRALHKLELMNQPIARIPKGDGTYKEIPFTDVKVGMLIALLPGDEIPADATITESHGLEVNESMLTGESLPVEKPVESTVLSSTSVVAGTALATVTAIGADTKAGIMSAKLKVYNPELTPLQKLINQLIFYLTFFALGLAALIAIVYWNDGYSSRVIFKTITSAGITVIPEGLLLASTLLLAFGSLKLARQKVLPQKLSAIEGMALLNVLCTDKTGTLTSDDIMFDRIELFTKKYDEQELKKIIGTAALLIGGGNATSDAIIHALSSTKGASATEVLAFSSRRKLSGVRFKIGSNSHSIVLGAPEYVSTYAPITKTQQSQIDTYTAQGLRVLLVASMPYSTSLKKMGEKSGTALGIILLKNELREGIVHTVEFLQKRGVSLRVISGDNPSTVQYITESAGIRGAKHIITGAELAALSPEKWEKTVLATTIFARVLPEQKEAIIETFKQNGHYTGMVGDGVNDALALKKSDLGVAMYSGAVATRRVADIVLLNNSFNSLPIGMRLGNRIMQAIEIVAVLSFHKIIFGVTILFLTILIGLQYPFAPRHNTFMNIFAMSLPTLMWTLFPPLPRHRVNPRDFWRDTLVPILPIGLITGFAATACYVVCKQVFDYSYEMAGTITVIATVLLAIAIVLQSGRIMGVRITKSTRIAQAIYLVAAVLVACFGFGFSAIRKFFDFEYPHTDIHHIWPIAAIVIVAFVCQWVAVAYARKQLMKRSMAIEARA